MLCIVILLYNHTVNKYILKKSFLLSQLYLVAEFIPKIFPTVDFIFRLPCLFL